MTQLEQDGPRPAAAIPASIADVSSRWLGEALEEPVEAIDVSVIGQGEGFVGQLARIRLSYGSGASPTAPASVVVKLPTADPGGRAIGEILRLWEREHRFYAEVAERVSVRVPIAYANQADPGAGAYALVLEDLHPMTTTDQITGATPQQARRVVDELADLHTAWWSSPLLDELDWMPDVRDPIVNAVFPIFEAGWPAFCERYRTALPERVFGWVEEFAARAPTWIAGMVDEPSTLSHGDARLDNMMFGADGSFAMVDWQMAMRVAGTSDLVYFVATNLTPDVRRQEERGLLRRYLDRVVAGGATGQLLNTDGLALGYRQGLLFWCMSLGSSIVTLDPANERGAALLDALVHRLFIAADDLDCGEVIPA